MIRNLDQALELISVKLAGQLGCSLLWGELELPEAIKNEMERKTE